MLLYSSPGYPEVVKGSDREAINYFMPYILAEARKGGRHNISFLGGVPTYAAKDGGFLVWELSFKAGGGLLDLSFAMFRRPEKGRRGERQMPAVTLGDVLD